MDFFERQDKARRNTWLLFLYFILAIVLIAVAVNLAFYLFFSFTEMHPYTPSTWFTDQVWLYVSGATLVVILLGSLIRYIRVAGGGRAVAEMAGGRLVDLDTRDSHEKVYINVVEEMAIASGVPMPSLYVMDNEPGINAFVAGFKPTETVMVVTQGTLDTLNRDELQGVVGHEFSHILNGDMRINIRLMAILAGILAIGQIGEFLLRGNRRSHLHRSSSRNNKGQGAIIVLALALLMIGYIGLFFGRLIKAAISRQREFLADASSVQFTRNPKGIAGALYKISQSLSGTLLQSRHAEDMSHMCFGETMKVSLSGLLATHPPLAQRIEAVDPLFLKTERAKDIIQQRNQQDHQATPGAMSFAGSADSGATDFQPIHANASQLTASVGNPTPEHLAYAAALHRSFSSSLLDRLHTPDGAKAVVYGLILGTMDRTQGMALLKQLGEASLMSLLGADLEALLQLDKRQRLPLIDLLLPALKRLSAEQRNEFLQVTRQLVKADQRFTLFEFVLLTILQQQLSAKAERADKVKYFSFKPVLADAHLLLSVLSQSSGQNKDKIQQSFQRGLSSFTSQKLAIKPLQQIKVSDISRALMRLNQISPMLKRSLIDVCADTVLDDGIIMPGEAELLRAIAETLDCPMPPLLPAAGVA